jgi:hypothetical protein
MGDQLGGKLPGGVVDACELHWVTSETDGGG